MGSLANLKAYLGQEIRPCAEFDGLIMGVDRRRQELVMQIVEAKDLRQRPAAAASQALVEKMRLLGAHRNPVVRIGAVRSPKSGKDGRAWVYIRIQYVCPNTSGRPPPP